MEEGQPGSPKDFNRTGNPAIGTLSWQSFQERDPAGYRKLVTSVMRDDFTIGQKEADLIRHMVNEEQDYASALRWRMRGLTAEDAAHKANVDREIKNRNH